MLSLRHTPTRYACAQKKQLGRPRALKSAAAERPQRERAAVRRPDADAAAPVVPGATKKKSGDESGDEYASEHEEQRTKDDDAFIDHEDDDADLVREYDAQAQDFRDERPEAVGFARKRKRETKRSRSGGELGDAENSAAAATATKGAKRKVDDAAEELRRRTAADKLLHAMAEAARADRVDAKAGRTATQKLRLLPSVRAATASLPMHDLLLDGPALGAEAAAGNNLTICKAFRDWLKPLPPAELPQLTLRSAVYEMLAQLPVASSHLAASRLGEVLLVLSQHPAETPENRKRLERLLERYMRLVFGKSARYDARGIDGMLAAQQEAAAAASAGAPRGGSVLALTAAAAGGADAAAAAGLGALMGGDDTALVSALLAAAAHDPENAASGRGGAEGGASAAAAAEPARQTRHAHVPAPVVMDFVRRPSSDLAGVPAGLSRKALKAAEGTPAAILKKRIVEKKRALKSTVGGLG